MSDGYILQMKNITKTFPGVKALSDVTLEVSEASIHAICGENGAGKSTLMKVLSGVYPYGSYDGEIVFQGKKMTFKNIKDSERAGIVIIHQEAIGGCYPSDSHVPADRIQSSGIPSVNRAHCFGFPRGKLSTDNTVFALLDKYIGRILNYFRAFLKFFLHFVL